MTVYRKSGLIKSARIRKNYQTRLNCEISVNFELDKICRIAYSRQYNRKGSDEEEYVLPLKRENGCSDAGALKGCSKEGMRKVASKPGI